MKSSRTIRDGLATSEESRGKGSPVRRLTLPPLHARVQRLQHLAGNTATMKLLNGTRFSAPQVQRMSLMKARMLVNPNPTDTEEGAKTRSKNSTLLAEWLQVHSADYSTLLEPLTEESQLFAMLGDWEKNPSRPQLLEEAKQRAAEADRQNWIRSYANMPIVVALTTGVNELSEDAAKLRKLLENFKKEGPSIFNYTMRALNPRGFFGGGKDGDCNTLTHSFRDIATNLLRIPVTIVSSGDVGYPQRFLTPEHRTIDGKTGNVMGKHWAFENHFWVHHAGVDYDVLFGEAGTVDTSQWIPITSAEGKVEQFGKSPNAYKVEATDHDEVEKRYVLLSGPD